MRRSRLESRLDASVLSSRITLLHGLPRVGRTRVATEWAQRRDDAAIVVPEAEPPDAPILLYDHLRDADIAGFVAQFRAFEAAERPTRFVVVPSSLAATRQLLSELVGVVHQIDVDPMQLDDYLNESTAMSVPQGPVSTGAPQAVATNAAAPDPQIHWLRGGLPQSLTAESDAASLSWRRDMLNGLFDRDYSSWSLPPGLSLLHVLQWAANKPGSELVDTDCPNVKRVDLLSALHVLERLGVTRRLSNFPAGAEDGMSRKPKLYIRDSGLLHAMMGIETLTQLRAHENIGESWESYAIEALIDSAGDRVTPQFYRIKGDEGEEEIDLVLDFRTRIGRLVACEFKTSPVQGPRSGFYGACEKIEATDRFIVHSGAGPDVNHAVHRLDLTTAARRIADIVDQVAP